MTSGLADPVRDRMPSGDEMLNAYLDSCRRMIAIVRGLDETDAERKVPACPAWTVRNLASHVTSVGSKLINNSPWGDDPQIAVDSEVAARADHSLAEIADEWEQVINVMAGLPIGPGAGPLVVDAVTHEHDLRAALGAEYRDHDKGLAEGLSAIVAWVRHLGLIDSPGIVLRTPTSEAVFGDGPAGAEVELADDWELFRVLGVRRSAEQLAALPQTGDHSLLLKLTGRYPLPEAPLEVDG